jgi:hypothetical protein
MPSIKQTANTSGALLWNEQSRKKGYLEGLKIDNRSPSDEKIELLDCFTTDASITNATGATQAAEDFSTYVGSGKVRFQTTVPAGGAISLGKEDLKEVNFLGAAYVRGDLTTSDCVVICQYALR